MMCIAFFSLIALSWRGANAKLSSKHDYIIIQIIDELVPSYVGWSNAVNLQTVFFLQIFDRFYAEAYMSMTIGYMTKIQLYIVL